MRFLCKHRDGLACFALACLVLVIGLPFLDRAFHIDEPLLLRIAQQIKAHPLDPYGFVYLWDNEPMSVWRIAAFPPLLPYYLAAVSPHAYYPPEWLIRAAMLPFAIAATLAFYGVARRLGYRSGPSFLASALWACSPAFAVSATLAMPDMAGIACALLALYFALRGWQNEETGALVLGGLFLGLAVLLRYNALCLLPVFPLIGLSQTSSRRKVFLPTLLALGAFAAWLAYSKAVSSTSHGTEVVSTFLSLHESLNRLWAMGNGLTLSTWLPILFALLVWPKSPFWAILCLVAGTYYGVVASTVDPIVGFRAFPDSFFFAAGFFVVAFAIAILVKELAGLKFWKRDASSDEPAYIVQPSLALENHRALLTIGLALWLLGALSVPIVYVHFASKYLLFAQPPLILLLLDLLKERSPKWRWAFAGMLPFALAGSLMVAKADAHLANGYRSKARTLVHQLNMPRMRIWFMGHWGWQYYLEKMGLKPLPAKGFEKAGLREGDIILRATFASPQPIYPALNERIELRRYAPVFDSYPLRTMSQEARAGFYSNIWGPLPFAISEFPIENIAIYDVVR